MICFQFQLDMSMECEHKLSIKQPIPNVNSHHLFLIPIQAAKIRIGKLSIIIKWITKFEILVISNVADQLSSEWTGPYTRKPIERMAYPIHSTSYRVNWPHVASGSEHIFSTAAG